MTNPQIDFTARLAQVQDTTRANQQGGFGKVRLITYYIGPFGPFTDEVPDSPSWEQTARQVMQARANSVRTLAGA